MNSLLLFNLLIVVSLNFTITSCAWHVWDKNLDWWQTTTLYQIYPRSFQDSDGDGIGDLKGIESRLDYFVETGIKTIWLSPIFKSPMNDLGYDVASFFEIDKIFGTLDDFKKLVNEIKKRGMYILMDFVPNHTSDEHDWFIKSIKGEEPYKDYYMWRDGEKSKDGIITEPNNWLSLFGGPGWTWNEKRQQYYYHQFSAKQPDLNLSNPEVQNEMKDILKFWLDLGVDGFRVDAVKHFMEDPEFHDEVCRPEYADNCKSFEKMIHNYTTDWPTTYDLIIDWRKFLREYQEAASSKHTRIMLTEAYTSLAYTMAYYGNETHPGAHAPFNFFLVLWPKIYSNSSSYINMINTWYDNMPEGQWGNWVAGNHDNRRVASKLGNEMVDTIFFLGMLLPGTAVTYQGDEIGQPDCPIRPDQIQDPNNNGGGSSDVRDPERCPFLWDFSQNSGFTSAKQPWLPIHPSFWELNLQSQKNSKKSHYKVYKQIMELRNTHTIQRGSLELHNISTWVFAFSRRLSGNDTYTVVFNVGSEMEIVALGEYVPKLPNQLHVIVSSINSGYEDGETIDTKVKIHSSARPLILWPKASVVLSTSSSIPKSARIAPSSASRNSIFALNRCQVLILFLLQMIVTFSLNI